MKHKILIWSLLFSISGFAQNVLTNGDFSNGLSSWTNFLATWIPVNATINANNDEANITNITGAGGATWYVQLNQEFTGAQISSLQVGSTYTLSFDARSNTSRSLRSYFGENGGGFTPVNITDWNITSTMTNYQITFTVNQTFGAMKLGFEMGLSNAPVFIDNVSLTQNVGGGPVAPNQPVGLVASNTAGGAPVPSGGAFLACGPNNVGGNVIYRLFYAPTASAPVDPTTATEYNFGETAGDGGGSAAFGFTLTGLTPATNYTFWLYQYHLVNGLFSLPTSATVVTGDGVVPQMRNVTFRVDMSQYGGSFTTPAVNGTFNGWCGACNPMTNVGGSIWETTIQLLDGNYEYKFTHDGWTGQENLTPGSPCTVTNGGFTNRSLSVTNDVTLTTVCWNNCAACNVGPQVRNVTFRVDMSQYGSSFTTPEVNGIFNSWCGACNPMTNTSGNIWETTIQLFDGNYVYKFSHDAWSGEENLTPGSPCTATDGGFTNRTLTVTDNVILPIVCWNSCTTCSAGPVPPAQPAGLVAFNTVGGNPVGAGEAFLACGPNNVGANNIVYKLFYAPTASAPVDPTTASEYTFGNTAGDGNGTAAFGFVITGLIPSTSYTFWVYQYNTVTQLYSAAPATASVVTGAGGPVGAPNQPAGFVAFDNIGGNPVSAGQAFLACGPNNVGSGNIVYKLFYAPTASAPSNPLTATQYTFGNTAGDGNGTAAFGFVISGLTPSTSYTFWLYQYNTVEDLYSASPAVATVVTGGTAVVAPNQPVGFVALNNVGGNPVNFNQAFLACGPNNVGGSVIYLMYYSPTATAPVDPTTATEYNFGDTPGDGGGAAAFGFVFSGLAPSTQYTFWLYQYNLDVNLFSTPAMVTYTTGAAPTQLQSGDCGATNVTMNQVLRANNVNAPVYRFKVSGGNNGSQGWSSGSYIYDSPNRSFKFSNIPGSYWGQTYSVQVAIGDGMGNFGQYGSTCFVTLASSIPTTSLEISSCGITTSHDQNLFATSISGAQAYRFRLNGGQEIVKTQRKFKMNEFANLVWGQTYSVDVAVQDADGNWGAYGTPCNVTISPSTQLQGTQCGIIDVMPSTSLQADIVSGATGYKFKITGPNNGATGWVGNEFILNRPNRTMTFAMVPGFLQGQTYSIQVAATNNGTDYTAFGNSCIITLFGIPELVINDNEMFVSNRTLNEMTFEISASQNPFNTDFGIQVLNANDSETIYVLVYDMSGKIIERNTVSPVDIENARFGSNLASGMYMVAVVQGSNQAVMRQVKN